MSKQVEWTCDGCDAVERVKELATHRNPVGWRSLHVEMRNITDIAAGTNAFVRCSDLCADCSSRMYDLVDPKTWTRTKSIFPSKGTLHVQNADANRPGQSRPPGRSQSQDSD